jgi:hypothetical protein
MYISVNFESHFYACQFLYFSKKYVKICGLYTKDHKLLNPN